MPRTHAEAFSLTLTSDELGNRNTRFGGIAKFVTDFPAIRHNFTQTIQSLFQVPVLPGEKWMVALSNITFVYPPRLSQPNLEVNAVDIIVSIVRDSRIGSQLTSTIYRVSPAVLPDSASDILVNFVPADVTPRWVNATDDLYATTEITVEIRFSNGAYLPSTVPGGNLGTICNLAFTRRA